MLDACLARASVRFALATALALVACATRAADQLLPFGVEARGRLQLAIPEGWRVDVRPAGNDLPATTLRLAPADGSGVVLLTAMAPPKGAPSADALRSGVEANARELQPMAAEEKLRVETRSAPPAELAFVSASDRRWVKDAPPEGEWRHVTLGAASSGGLLVTFTVLTNVKDDAFRARALALVAGARHLAPGAGPSSLRVSAAGRTLSAELPGLEVLEVDTRPDGGGALVMGELPDGYAVTLTLESTPSLTRAAEVRELRWTKGAATTASEKTGVKLSTRGHIEAVEYLIPRFEDREIRQRHVHGYLLRSGVMGEVHLSKILHVPKDDAALWRLLDSARLE